MATETVPNAPSGAPASDDALIDARDRTLYEAASEAGALACLFRQTWEEGGRGSVEFECTIRGALQRIEALCTAVCILQGAHWKDNLAEEFRVVFGKPLEVSHG